MNGHNDVIAVAPAVSCDALVAMLIDVGNDIIDRLFPHWVKKENKRRDKLRDAQALGAALNAPSAPPAPEA